MYYVEKEVCSNYWESNQKETKLYALIDMSCFNQAAWLARALKEKSFPFAESISLFDGTPEATLKEFAPYLCLIHNVSNPEPYDLTDPRVVEKKYPAIIWIWSDEYIGHLKTHLQFFLNAKLKNGRDALFRFYDPRVFPMFLNMLKQEQAERFWNRINQCMLWDAKQQQHIIYRKKI